MGQVRNVVGHRLLSDETINEHFPRKEEKPAAPTTKKRPYCLIEIPIAATRCGHCTSMLEIEEENTYRQNAQIIPEGSFEIFTKIF